jgi:HD-like signal output (HDOD) protein/CheY-like chemotaxis protein
VPEKKQVLFVDDEPMVLEGLRRMLRVLREEWEFSFAHSGPEALAIMARKRFDVIVSDMRMPGMDGVELLNETKKRYPRTVRVALSGQTSKESVIHSVGPIHHYLAKPCHGERLKATLDRLKTLRDILDVEELQDLILEMESLPSLPTFYFDLLGEIESPEASVKKVGRIVARDISMTAKILQLVNSAFFGLHRHITDPAEAVTVLGLDTIKMLVVTIHIFSVFDNDRLNTFSLSNLWDHSAKAGLHASIIARCEGLEKPMVDYALLAGMLHDVGKLVLVDRRPEMYAQVLRQTREKGCSLIEAERNQFGTTHASIGGYLLGLWGFCGPVLDAVSGHHNPGQHPAEDPAILTAVHVGNALARRNDGDQDTTPPEVDESYLARRKLLPRLAEWRMHCDAAFSEEVPQ